MRKPKEMYIVKYAHVRGQLHPMLRFALSCNGKTATVEAYVDTGAAFSLFSPDEAEKLSINYRSGRLRWVQGVGGVFVPTYLHSLRIIIGRFSFKATVQTFSFPKKKKFDQKEKKRNFSVGFSDHIGVGFNLIGRKDIFKKLSFTLFLSVSFDQTFLFKRKVWLRLTINTISFSSLTPPTRRH
jgi:hypothetical protein